MGLQPSEAPTQKEDLPCIDLSFWPWPYPSYGRQQPWLNKVYGPVTFMPFLEQSYLRKMTGNLWKIMVNWA
jgi:hypothetical protein